MKTSVALCTYNGEKYIREQLDSILRQTVAVNEIVVCDDCSTDSTVSILENYNEKYPNIFRIYKNDKNLKSVKNFEKAISLCSNEIIFLSDQDDIWLNTKVERMLDVFTKNQDVSVIATNGFGIDENSNIIDVLPVWDFPKIVTERGFLFDNYNVLNLTDNFCTGATMAFKKEMNCFILPFPEIEKMHHDEWIALVSVLENNFYFLDEKLIYYREHCEQQVGNVFYENTEDKKKYIANYFSIDKAHKNFNEYKKMLKRFSITYHQNKKMQVKYPLQESFYEKNAQELKRRFRIYQVEMTQQYPFKSFILKLIDKIKGKRKL